MKWSTKTTNVAPIRDFNGNNKWWLVMLGNLQIYVQRITCYYCWVLASEAAAEQDSRKQNRNIGITPRKRFPGYHHRYCCLCGGSGVVVLQWKVFLCRFQWTRKRGFGVFCAFVFWWLWTEWFIATCLRCAPRCLQRTRVAGRSHQVIIIIRTRHLQNKSRKNRNWYLWADNWFMRGFSYLRCVDVRQRFFG